MIRAPRGVVANHPLPGREAYAARRDLAPHNPNLPDAHVATLVETPDGGLLYGFYAGSQEAADDVGIYGSRLRVGERVWEEPRLVFDEPGRPAGNAVLLNNGAGSVYLFLSTIRGEGWTEAELGFVTSTDNGATWSEPTCVRGEWGWLFGTRPLRMSNGEVILPVYDEGAWSSGFYVSADEFHTWEAYPEDQERWLRSPGGAIQPSTVELECPGHLLAYLRTRDGLVYRAESFDYGRIWTEAVPTALPNPHSRVALLRLASGALALAYNPTSSGRSPLRLALSEDGGATWPHAVDVETEPGEEFSYPYLIETGDGFLHLGYTHRRRTMREVVCNEEFVRSGPALPSDPEPGVLEYWNGVLERVEEARYRLAPRGGASREAGSGPLP